MMKESLCAHCGNCLYSCDHEECQAFGRCIHRCPNGCLSVSGQEITSEELAERLRGYGDFLRRMGGGITVSGGEPLLQHLFVRELADRLGEIHKAIQTSGYATHEVYRRTVEKFDFIMQDIKLVKEEDHRRYTGVSNQIILQNIAYLKDSGKEFVLRVPLIPTVTDTEENLTAISAIAEGHRVELLRYNAMAGAKYAMLGYEFPLQIKKENTEGDPTRYFQNAVLC